MKRTMEGKEKWPLASRAIFLVVLMFSILAICPMIADAAPLPETAYSVTYVANGAASGSAPMDSNPYAEADSVQVLPNTGGLIREGYVFGGWRNDNSIYQPNETFTMGASDVILSAVWIPIYSVSYDGNMNVSGYAPVDSQLYPGGAYVTVLANSSNLDQSFGFKCWNTKADGSGSTYYPDDTFRMGAGNITLYALYYTTPPVILVQDDYTVTYNRNGASSGFVPVDNTKNASITVSGNSGSLLRDGYAFAGWNTKSDGSGTTYQPGDTVYLSASLTLYVLWNPVHTVNYDPNGGEAYFATSNQYPFGAKVKLVDYAGFIQPPIGKVFAGWNTKADGTGTAYMPDDVVTISSDLTLYPVWDQNVYNKQSVVFRGNGNTEGSVPAICRLTNGQTVTLAGQGTLKRDGYIFDGWFYDSTYYYKAGDSVGVWGSNITLYAKWVAVCTVTYDSNKATGGTVPLDTATYIPDVQVTVLNNTGGLRRTDGFFLYWNTKPDGSGTTYWPGASFTISTATTLYAIYSMVILVPPEPFGRGVYYYGNRAESGVAPENSLGYAVGNTVTVQNNPGNLTRYGYNFAGWNTRADGTGATYQPGATFSFPANMEFVALFAVWNKVIISQIRNLEYNGNGNSGGNSPDSEYIDVGGSLPVSGRNTLYKMGYEFVNWNTHADGSGETYSPGDSISSTGSVIILYAQWTGQTNFTHVSYQVNASYGTYTGTLPTDSWLYPAGALILVKSSDISISGRYFAGWNTEANLSGRTYLPGDTITVVYDDITLYAVFLAGKPFYVFYNGNGNIGGAPPTDAKRYSCGYSAGQTVTVANEYTLSKGTEYFFAGWNTASDGSGITYKGGETFPIGSENVTLYAIWKTYPNSAAVTYNDNGSTSGIAPTESTLFPFGASVTLAANSGNLLKTGHIFYGWWVNGALYKPGATFTMPNRSVTVYAVWASTATFRDTYRVTYDGNGSTGGTVPSDSTGYLPVESVMLAGNPGNLVRPGYAFGGWSDRISLYETGQTFIMGSAQGNITLYAVWLPIYTMSYDGNGNTGGSVPIDTSVYTEGQSATVLGNVNEMARTNYLFDGWYFNGRLYHPGDILVFGASGVTATAVWVYAPSDDASLHDLTAGGSTVGGFAAGQYEYQVQLPYGTLPGSAAAMVGAAAADTNATIQITQAANLPGDAKVTVTSVSQVTTSTYTIHFTLEAEANTPPNRKASVPAAATASVTIGETYTVNLSDIFEDANSDPLTYQVSVNGSVYGAASTVYTYQLTSVGQTTLVFKVNDGTADSTDTYTLTLTASTAPTYGLTLSQTGIYTFPAQTEGYSSTTPQSITVNRTGTGDITNLQVALSGTNQGSFILGTFDTTTLNSSTTSAAFTIMPKDGLTAGIYTATVTVTADNGINVSFNVSFTVSAVSNYSVSIGSLTGGSITAGPTSAAAGTAINLTITPDAGMQLKAGTLKYNDGTADHTISGTGFTMPAANVTVSAEFEAVPPAPISAPVLQSAATNNSGTQIILTFSKAMTNPESSAGAFNVSVIRSNAAMTESITQTELDIDSSQIILSLAQPLLTGDTVSVSYTPGTLTSSDGGILDGFTNQAVTNQAPQPLPVSAGNSPITVSAGQTNFAITPDTVNSAGTNPIIINVPSGVTNTTLNVAGLLQTPSSGTVTSSPLPGLTVTAAVYLNSTTSNPVNVQVQIPQGTTVSAPEGWDGTIQMPTVQATNSVTVTPTNGTIATVGSVIEIGFGNVPLTFNQAVRILIPGQAGKKVGYVRNGIFYPINTVLNADNQSTADSTLAAGQDGYINVGTDLVIWTKHFTQFVTYTETTVNNGGGNSNGGGGGPYNPAPTPTPTMVTGSIIDGTTGAKVANLTATVTTDSNGNETISMKAAQILMLKQPDGSISTLDDISQVAITDAKGTPVTVASDGTIQVPDLAKGTDHYFYIKYDLSNGQKITIGTMEIKIDSNGNVTLTTILLGVTRLAGQSRVDTALAIAKAEYQDKVANVILATADNYPDALAGSVLAYKLNAPILLVGSSDADQEKVLIYMKSNLDPAGTVYILGGTAVVSSAMEGKVTASGFANITRLGGTDRYETSVKIAEQLKVKTGTPIVLSYGENYPDALSISSIAAKMQYPILLVQKDGLSDVVKKEIAAIKPAKVYIIGGEGVISTTVESQVAQITSLDRANIVRIAGADRYETSLAVAQTFNLTGQNVCIATGNNFPDALAGSVYGANHNAPIILADGSLSDQVMNYLKTKKLTGATLFGGEAVVSKSIEQQLRELIGQQRK